MIIFFFFFFFSPQAKTIHYKQTFSPTPAFPNLVVGRGGMGLLCALLGGASSQLHLGRALNFPEQSREEKGPPGSDQA